MTEKFNYEKLKPNQMKTQDPKPTGTNDSDIGYDEVLSETEVSEGKNAAEEQC